MDNREVCNYKEKCYRKKYDHFEQFKHPHLEELLEKIGVHEIHVPFGYIPSVSFSTLKSQLEIERKIRATKITDGPEPQVKRAKVSSQSKSEQESPRQNHGDFSGNLNSPNAPSQPCENTLNNVKMSSQENRKRSLSLRKESSQVSNEEISRCGPSGDAGTSYVPTDSGASPRPSYVPTDSVASPRPSYVPTDSVASPQPGSSKKSFEKQRVSAARHSANMAQAEEFRQQVESQILINIADKLRAASPYNILYTGLESTSRSSPDRLAVTFPELLDSPLGLLEDSLLINFMIQFGWVLACYFTMGHSNKPMTLLYGETDTEFGTKFSRFLKHAKVEPPSAFGSHHTKMMIFHYLDKSIRIVICTANLIESDWVNRTQGVWISEKCEELFPGETGGDSRTNFKRDLLAYLGAYNLPVLQPWIDKVKRADMSHINVFFIGSVPGTHKMCEGKWGQARLRSVLKERAPIVENNSYKVITQISSIGSLGPNPDSWLMGDILTTFATTKPSSSLLARPSLSVIYPSFLNVERSVDGLLGGGCLPYSSTTHRKQEWLSNYLHNWKADGINRTRAVPHIKSYTRVSPDCRRISYFLLTSANLSKAAWGVVNKSQGINVLSYEAGVLLLPEFIFGEGDYFPLKEETGVAASQRKPHFTLPYDLPLVPYGINDIPWFIDNLPM